MSPIFLLFHYLVCNTCRFLFVSSYCVSVSFDIESLGGKAADKATPVEAINYFCDIRMEEELERARTRARVKTPVQAQDNSRNTVLVLPKIHRYIMFFAKRTKVFVVKC